MSASTIQQTNTTNSKGFHTMDAARHKEICSEGGRAAHAKGVAPKFTPDSGREARLNQLRAAANAG